MNADKNRIAICSSFCVCLCSAVALLLNGCAKPSAANIDLRKQNQDLRAEVEQLKLGREGDLATIRSLQEAKGSLPTLPPERLDQLFTTHGLKLGRLSGGARTDPAATSDDALKIYVVPTDQTGDELKAAGSFVVEAFDLASSDSPRVGRWTFDVEAARKCWLGDALLYEYVLPCPLERRPAHGELTVRVMFTDALSQRTFEAQKVIHVTIDAPSSGPATSQPSTRGG
jgi:hypothetical protein